MSIREDDRPAMGMIESVREEPAQAVTVQDFPFYVVGVGASAGGLEALEEFFDALPSHPGVAVVVVQHLSPDFRSVMDELLARHTSMAIYRVEDGMPVRPNAVYLIPPKKEMIISGGRLLLTDKDPAQSVTLPIDIFFRSLAQDVGRKSVAVVLSGTGSDGSRGICDVHAAGGLVLAQTPDSAQFDGMPNSAVDTGVVDFVQKPGELAGTIVKYVERAGSGAPRVLGEPGGVAEQGVEAILKLMRETHAIDFAPYKPNTIARRIERRVMLSQAADLDEYIGWLRENPPELHLLYKDLLIGVTKFFRDREAFDRLARFVLPQLAEQLGTRSEFRVWVPGCATGEEAYSIAILFHEFLQRRTLPQNVKVFATDVHRASLDHASAGCYSEANLSELAPERIERYFTRRGDGFQVIQDIRQMVVFATHNVLKDAPFTKLDLISCRNLLIYFQPVAQKKALCLFHFGLKTGGYLLLGPSETPGELGEEFETLDQRWKIYRKKRDVRLPTDPRLPLVRPHVETRPSPARPSSPAAGWSDRQVAAAQETLLETFAPPSLLVDEQMNLVHAFNGGGRYLKHPDGKTSLQLLDLVERELKLALAGAVQRARKEGQAVVYTGIWFEQDGERRPLKVTVQPVVSPIGDNARCLLIALQEQREPEGPPVETRAFDADQISRERIWALENELQYTKENLQATVEEMETANEELQAANEELVASNEQLQSTNEELHSVNEELYSVNAEYQRKITELTELTSDMENLLASTEIATIFLDRSFSIRKFTPQVAELFHFLPQDLGRRIDNFSHNLNCKDLPGLVQQVLADERQFEVEVQDHRQRWFLMRILPYRSSGKVEGVVVALIGVDQLKRTEAALRRMSKVFMDGADPILIEDLSGTIVDLNREAERVYGWTRDELLGQSWEVLVPEPLRAEAGELRRRCREGGHVRNVETTRQTRAGQLCPVLLTLSLLRDDAGGPSAIATIAKDIRRRKRAEQEAQEAVRRRDQFLAMLSHELRNPLGAVLHAAQLLRADEFAARASVMQAADVIQRQSQHIARLLNDLLDVARITQGKIHLQQEPMDLVELVPSVVEAVEPVIRQRRHELRLRSAKGPLVVVGDPARLRQVQENLLTNAAKFTPPGGTIELTLDRIADQAVIRVADTGAGFSPEMGQTIFELFAQGEGTLARSHGGMGVGLTLVRALVELHGGCVEAHSDGPGRGSTFTVRLPLTEQPLPRKRRRRRQRPRRAAGLKVLIVEDMSDSRAMLSRLLEMEGCEVRVAADGVEGLQVLADWNPNLAMVDIGLPGMDGYELARRAREQRLLEGVELVALTGYGRAEDRRMAQESGFHLHLVKPLEVDQLRQLLDRLSPPAKRSALPE